MSVRLNLIVAVCRKNYGIGFKNSLHGSFPVI